nr:unnamed protein product [Callosobruchus chinensis]
MDRSLTNYELTESTIRAATDSENGSGSDKSEPMEMLGFADIESSSSNGDFDNNLPETVTLLKHPTNGAKVYLIGTAHFSKESQEDVIKVIRNVRPHIVVLELCSSRTNMLCLDEETILEEAKNIDMQKIMSSIKTSGVYNGLMYILLLQMTAHITKEIGMAPGGEFRVAHREASKIPNCKVHLGDRPINITILRALSRLTWFQTLKLTWQLLALKEPISVEDIEKCKNRDMLEQLMAELSGDFPGFREVFLDERDVILTNSLQVAAQNPLRYKNQEGRIEVVTEPLRIVGVVGMGHMQGIINLWPHDQSGKMLKLLLSTLLLQAALVSSQSRQSNVSQGTPGLRPILLFIERLLDSQASNQQPRALRPQQSQTQTQQSQQPQQQSQQPQQSQPQSTPQTAPQPVQPPTQQPIQLIYQGVPPLFQPTILPQFPLGLQQLQQLQLTGQSGQQSPQGQPSAQGQQSGQNQQQQQVIQQQPSPQQVQQQQYVRLLDPNQQQQRLPSNLTVPLPQEPQLQQPEPVQPILQPAQPPAPNVYQHLFGRQGLFPDPNQPGAPSVPGQYGYNYIHDKQRQPGVYGRVPQFFVYRPEQPILINPGSVPGNFLPPSGPGIYGGPGLNPGIGGRNPFFVGGGGGGQPPRPNFVPPIEKDAEEIPTDPSKIPPFNGGKGSGQSVQPEKLETLDEGKPDFPPKPIGEADVNHQQFPSYGQKPGHKFFFILNGQTLLPHSAFEKYNGYNLGDEQIQHGGPNKEEFNSNIPEEYRDTSHRDEHHEEPGHPGKEDLQSNIPQEYVPQQDHNEYRDSKYYSDDKYPQNFFGAEHGLFFRNSGPGDAAGGGPEDNVGHSNHESGQFRYSPPGDPYLPFGDESENDSVVVDADFEDRNTRGSSESTRKEEPSRSDSEKEDSEPTGDPSTAQAAPGAIAIAGPGGVAGASPKATALAGKRGLAVSSPQATAVAGTETTKQHARRRTRPNKSENK